jgi:hypothetical protein
VGLQLLDNLISTEIGVTFDLPKTSVAITQLASDSVDAQCDKSSGVNVAQAYQADFQRLFPNLTHIATEFEVGVNFEMQAQVSDLPNLGFSSSIELATLPVATLPTQCLAFQSAITHALGLTAAASALKAVQVSASAAASASASAASVAAQRSGSAGLSGPSGNSASESRYSSVGSRICAWLFPSFIMLAIVSV